MNTRTQIEEILAAYWRNRPPRYYKGSRIYSVETCLLSDKVHLMRLDTGRGSVYAVFGYEPYRFYFFDSYSEACDYMATRARVRKEAAQD